MLDVVYDECCLCWMSFVLDVIYAGYLLCWMLFMRDVINGRCIFCPAECRYNDSQGVWKIALLEI